MSNRSHLVACLSLTLCLVGCDGHLRSLSVHNVSDPPSPWLLPVIENRTGRDIPSLVKRIAQGLGMEESPEKSNRYYKNLPNGFSFYASVSWSPRQNVWNIELGDWPTVQRSDISRKFEQHLRDALGQPPS
jgi:hypothetical protein